MDMIPRHDPTLVAAALTVCLLGTHTTFALAGHALTAQGRERVSRAAIAGAATGAAAWATHFLAMLALSRNVPTSYDVAGTATSILVAMTGCAIGCVAWLTGKSKRAAAWGGGLLAGSISTMHFAGMAASRMSGDAEYDAAGVAASIVAGTTLAIAATTLHRRDDRRRHVASATLLAAAVAAVHFGSMASMRMAHEHARGASSGEGGLAIAVGGVVVALMLLALSRQRASDRIDHERDAADMRLRHAANHDALTGLPNRVLFQDRLDRALGRTRRDGTRTALLYLDLDGFKAVNDQYGHARGDETLARVAALMGETVRETDTLARIGGDEFVIIQEGVTPEGARTACDRVIERLREEYGRGEIRIGVSIGVAFAPHDAANGDDLVRRADVALYRAKAEGRGTARFFEHSMDEAARERRDFERDLRSAVAARDIRIVYQPQMDAADGSIRGFEVLARWTSDKRGAVPPDRFIPVAERIGVIGEIGDQVLWSACREAAGWRNPLRVAVNLSAMQIVAGGLVERVGEILAETGLAADRLELEVTETAILRDQEATLATLSGLRALGVKIAMDDFGTGYSSLSSLHSFPFDKLKVDKSFVAGIGADGKASSIVKAVIGLGRSLELPIVAEGVETVEQLSLLKRERCTEIQGYLVGRPQPIEAWAHLVDDAPVLKAVS